MAKIAFCGLGLMGSPMAMRLVEHGHDVAVWNRTATKADRVGRRGARATRSPAAAADGAEVAITMLTDPPALEAVVHGDEGLAQGLRNGTTLIDMSTVGPNAVRQVAERLPTGVSMIDAPVLGTVPQAEGGDLRIFAGGDRRDVDRHRPVLETMGSVTYMGSLGAGASMKLVANTTLGALMTALGEALALADSLGLEQGPVLDILADSPIGVTVNRKRPSIESGSYPATFKLGLASKDLELVNDRVGQGGLDLRVAPAAGSWLEDAWSAGLGDLDYSAVVAHIRGQPARP